MAHALLTEYDDKPKRINPIPILAVGIAGVIATLMVANTSFRSNGIVARMLLSEDVYAERVSIDRMLAHVTFQRITIACPTADMSLEDRERWVAYAKTREWAPYPAAGNLCVDPP
jgi:hypothetical protein